MFSFSKTGKFLLPSVIAASLSLMLSGCGKGSADSEGEAAASVMSADALGEYTYVADYVPLDMDDSYSYQFADGKLYSLVGDTEGYTDLKALDVSTGQVLFQTDVRSLVESPAEKTENDTFYAGIGSYQVMKDGSIRCILSAILYSGEDYETVSQSYELLTLSDQGEVLSRTDLSSELDLENDYISFITVDAEGQTILVTGKQILRFGESTEPTGSIVLSEDAWVNSILKLEDETLLMMYDQDWNMNAYRMNFDSAQLEEAYTGFGSNSNNFFVGKDGSVLEVTSQELRRRDLKDGSTETVITWTDCDVVGDYVQSVVENEDGTFSLILHSWQDDTTELATLRQVKRSEVGEVQELTIATLYEDQTLTRNVVNYNKSQKQVHISIQTFYDFENGSYEDAQIAFNNALTGANPPDMVALDSVDLDSMNYQSLLEDLRPYLEKSTVLPISDYEDYVLDCATRNGKLLAIPTALYIDTLVVSSDLVPADKSGWTVDEMLDLLEAHPEASALEYSNRDYVMNYFLGFALDGFVDWENGTCNFDSDTFRRILDYLKTQPEEFQWDENDTRSSAGKIADGDLLFLQSYMSDPSEIQVNDAVMGGKAVYIGYPTLDGSPASNMSTYGGYSILSGSSNKEAAWAFIEYCNKDSNDSYALPARTSLREKMLEDYVSGKQSIEGNGVGWGDDFQYTYHNVTKEEAEIYNKVLATGKVRSDRNEEIIKIITEEAAPFYAGQKSVEDVMQVIQSRVSLYVNENK